MSPSDRPKPDLGAAVADVELLGEKEAAALRARPSVLLGLFVLGQLAFLFAANLLGMLYYYGQQGFPDRMKEAAEQAAPRDGHLLKLNETIYTLAWQWAQLTGQPQNWGLFAPVGTDCSFPALELRWEAPVEAPQMLARPMQLLASQQPAQVAAVATLLQSARWRPPETERAARHLAALAVRHPADVIALQQAAHIEGRGALRQPRLLLSENEPGDLHHYLRVGKFRLRRLEGSLLPYLPTFSTEEKTLAEWRKKIESHVGQYGPLIATYCRHRLEMAGIVADDKQPAQVILLMRRYRIRSPDDDAAEPWTGPQILPIARWQPRGAWGLSAAEVEWYNPETERFELSAK